MLLALTVLAPGALACGRLEYSPVAGLDGSATLDAPGAVADGATSGDAADGDDGGRICSVVEACDGLDDDCDASVDEGCPCTPFQVFVATENMPLDAVADWTGTGFGVAWSATTTAGDPTMRDLFFRSFDAAGTPLGPAIDVSRSGARTGGLSALAWNGVRHGALWLEVDASVVHHVRFATIEADGTVSTPVEAAPSGAMDARLVATAGGFAVASVLGQEVHIHRFAGTEHTSHVAGSFGATVGPIAFAADAAGAIVVGPSLTAGPALALPLDAELVASAPVASGGESRNARPALVRAGRPGHWLLALPTFAGFTMRPIDAEGRLAGAELATPTSTRPVALARAGPIAAFATTASMQFSTMRVDADTGAPLEAALVGGTAGNPYGEADVVGAAGRIAVAWMTSYRIELTQRCF
jgi:hypothetical protein